MQPPTRIVNSPFCPRHCLQPYILITLFIHYTVVLVYNIYIISLFVRICADTLSYLNTSTTTTIQHSFFRSFDLHQRGNNKKTQVCKMYTSPPPGSESYSIMECPMVMERSPGKWRCSNVESAPNCPRCASSNTKFCYYNNYSLSQPRYFCKGCRRYWTKGGSLRNVPVGGGCRKSRRARASRQGRATNDSSPTRFSGGCTNDSGAATDIDLAAVFAKYVSQNIRENEESCSPGGSSGLSYNVQTGLSEIDAQYLDDVTMFQYQKPLGSINGGHDQDQLRQLIPEISTFDGEGNGPDFIYQGCTGYDLQEGILGDDLGLLWSDESTILPGFEWQNQSMQGEDLGNFSPDDHVRVSANLASQNWGLFDLSAYEYFSRP